MNITVIAAKGLQVPYEYKANQYIDDQVAVEVPKNLYYLRRIHDGDLVEVKQAKPKAATVTTSVAKKA